MASIPKCLSRWPEVLVSSARTRFASFKMRSARRVISSKLPMGVGININFDMVDITDVNAEEGDEVFVFGDDPSIVEISEKLKTIPYEVLTGISRRVKRVYFQE